MAAPLPFDRERRRQPVEKWSKSDSSHAIPSGRGAYLRTVEKSLLVVEDDEIISEGLALALQDSGFRVILFDCGRPVPDLVSRWRPDAVVLDVTLPDISGVEVGRELRSRWPDLPIVFTSGHVPDAALREILAQPRTSMLQKPFEVQELVEAVERVTAG